MFTTIPEPMHCPAVRGLRGFCLFEIKFTLEDCILLTIRILEQDMCPVSFI